MSFLIVVNAKVQKKETSIIDVIKNAGFLKNFILY